MRVVVSGKHREAQPHREQYHPEDEREEGEEEEDF